MLNLAQRSSSGEGTWPDAKEVCMSRVVRCVFLFTAYITVMMSVAPSVPVLHANGSCACSGYVYAYDYYPVYGQFEGEASVSGSDDNATDYGYCANFCNYV